jgi:hypothetical protein
MHPHVWPSKAARSYRLLSAGEKLLTLLWKPAAEDKYAAQSSWKNLRSGGAGLKSEK